MSWLTSRRDISEVVDARTLADFAQQQLGTPFPTTTELVQTQKILKQWFAKNPQANWRTLANTIVWAKARRKRVADIRTLHKLVRYAWRDGYCSELDPHHVDEDIERDIERALETETDPSWRSVLMGARGNETRKEVLATWKERRVS